MASSVDDDSIGANARAWDFVMPPEGRWTVPLSSELGRASLVPKPGDFVAQVSARF